ncbi:MAG: AraC family transcriptional regulator [Gemmatimonadales bacterium]|nr:AraC family transcriptional regulator [Gemmatimonadales bacterium]
MAKVVGVGQFFAWEGGCLFIARHTSFVPVHAHQAIQLTVASAGEHQILMGDVDVRERFSLSAVPSRQPHGIDVTASEHGAVIFIEPETREGRALTERSLRGGIAEIGTDEAQAIVAGMFAAWLAGRRDETVAQARRLVQAVAGGIEPAETTDPRILAAIAYIGQRLPAAVTLDEVAAHACLSPGRFRHLFAEQTGMGLRPYVLWRRFMLVWELMMEGSTLSTAAHAAGFADSAHLSRTSTRTFGFSPSGMQFLTSKSGTPVGAHRTTA